MGASIRIGAGGTSEPLQVASLGAVVTLSPSACLAKVQYTRATLADIANGNAAWTDWPHGFVSSETSDTLLQSATVRVVSVDGNATLSVSDPKWQPPVYGSTWLSALGSSQKDAQPRGMRVALIGDSITGQAMYRVTATNIVAANGIATVTANAHNLFPGATVFMGAVNEQVFNGFKTVLERVSSSEFTFRVPADAPAAGTGSNITALNNARFQDRGWFELANASLGHPFTQIGCAGISGATIEEIANRFDLDALALNPDMVVIQGGINSIFATGAGNESAGLASIQAAFSSMIEKALNAGVIPLVVTCLPLSSSAANYTAARGQMVLSLNKWLRQSAAKTYPRMVLFDAWQAAVNPTSATGNYATNYSVDGIHLTALGAQRVAAAFESVLSPLSVPTPMRVGSILDTYDNDATNTQIFPNPLMQGTTGTRSTAGAGSGTNTGNVPDAITVQWTRAGTGTVVNSIVSRSDGIGSDHQLVVTSANANDAVQVDLISTIQARVPTEATVVSEMQLVMTSITALTSISFWLVWTLDGTVYTSPAAISGSTVGALGDNIDMVLRTPPVVIPPGSLTTFEPRFIATFSGAGGATIKIGRWSVTLESVT